MNIVVCVKPVMAYLLDSGQDSTFCINPYDVQALKLALEIKKTSQCHITCICMGGAGAEMVVRRCIAMGADSGVIVSDSAFAGSDTYATTYILSAAIKKLGEIDLIICGEKSVDGETAQVPVGLATRLGILHFSGVTSLRECVNGMVETTSLWENEQMTIASKLPILVVSLGYLLNEPALNLLAIKRARTAQLAVWNRQDLGCEVQLCGQKGSKTKVTETHSNLKKKDSLVINGDTAQNSRAVLDIIKEMGS